MTTKALAQFLAANIPAIACDEAAGELFQDVQNAVDAIERMINRPVEPKYCGPCPTLNEDQDICSVGLFTKWDGVTKQYEPEIECWKCHMTYNADELITDALSEVDGWLFTAAEVLETMAQIGEPISERTWRHWRKTGAIQSRNELGVEPKYFIGEVRYLRQTFAKTGRAS
jgi:hypothetical protein